MANPNEHEKPYLHAKPAPPRKTLTNMKTLEYKTNPNLSETRYLHAKPTPARKTLTNMNTLEYMGNPNIHEKTLPSPQCLIAGYIRLLGFRVPRY